MADRLALIIANGDFDDPKLSRLRTPTRDAEALAEVLSDPKIGDFDVTLLIDEVDGLVRRRIGWLYDQRSGSDLVLLYYSGHGIRDAHGDLYLATRDTDMALASATALSASFVRDEMDKSGSQGKVVILDCCHSGAFAKAGLGDSVGTKDAFAASGSGRVVLTASDKLGLAWEGGEWLGEGRSSVFTHFLVEGLRTGAADMDGDGWIALDELYRYVHDRVVKSTRDRQTPHKWAEGVKGQIIIAHSPVVRPAELPTELQRAIENALPGVRRGAVDELDRFLRGGHPGLALAAREALERLTDDDSRQVSTAARERLAAVDELPRPAPPAPPALEPGGSTRSPADLIPTWGWIVGGVVLALLAATLFIRSFGGWAALERTMMPTGAVPSAATQGPPTGSPVAVVPTAAPSPGDTPTRPADDGDVGRAMIFGQTVRGSIVTAAQMDTYTFTANAGNEVLVRMTTDDGDLRPGVRVHGPDGAQLCEASGISSAEIAACTLEGGGTYAILAFDTAARRTGDYYVYLQRLDNPGDPEPIAFGQTVPGSIVTAAQMDTYTFTASAGDEVLVRMTTDDGDLRPGVRVYGPDGAQLCEASGISSAEIAACTLEGGGTYAILAFDTAARRTGDYYVYLQRLDNPGDPEPVAFGQTVPGSIVTAAQMNTYTFTADAGDEVLVRMTTDDGDLRPGIRVYGPDGAQLCEASGISSAEIAACTLEGGGTYAILVFDTAARRTGAYYLYLQRLRGG
jgi:hypothetical protein